MSTQVNPAHNLVALLIGTGEFSFSPGATSALDARRKGYIDIGNIVAFTPNVEPEKEEHFGSYRGVRRKDRVVITQVKCEYEIKADEFNKLNIQWIYGATSGSDYTQAALSAVVGETLGFTAVPAVIGRWYELRSSAGAQLRNITSATLGALVEGTDFVLDLLLGRVKFLTAQILDAVPTITAPAIVSNTNASFLSMTPMADPVQSGFGRLVIYDQADNNIVVLDHREFSCDVAVNSVAEIDGTGFTELTLTVTVTNEPGMLWLRNENDNAGM